MLQQEAGALGIVGVEHVRQRVAVGLGGAVCEQQPEDREVLQLGRVVQRVAVVGCRAARQQQRHHAGTARADGREQCGGVADLVGIRPAVQQGADGGHGIAEAGAGGVDQRRAVGPAVAGGDQAGGGVEEPRDRRGIPRRRGGEHVHADDAWGLAQQAGGPVGQLLGVGGQERLGALGHRLAAALDLGDETGPRGEAVLAGERQLGPGQGGRRRLQPGRGVRVAGISGALELPRAAAELGSRLARWRATRAFKRRPREMSYDGAGSVPRQQSG